jgi:hypothetical protein
MGKDKFDCLLKLVGKSWASGDYMYLLKRKDLEMLAQKAGLASYRIIRNRFCGISMTFSLIW